MAKMDMKQDKKAMKKDMGSMAKKGMMKDKTSMTKPMPSKR